MDKTLRAIKRQLASKHCPSASNVLQLCPPYDTRNPYRESSPKHAKWCELRECVNAHHATTLTVHDATERTSYSASELWKEARLRHLRIDVRWHDHPESVSVVDLFDNVREQWTSVQVVCGYSQETLSVLSAIDHPHLTVRDICRHVENTCGGVWKPAVPAASEWMFLLQTSGTQTVLNTVTHMSSKWWSLKRFAHHLHNYSELMRIEVYACDFDREVQREMDLTGNRLPCVPHDGGPASPHVAVADTERASLREQQDREYYASLLADKEKQKRSPAGAANRVAIEVEDGKDVREGGIGKSIGKSIDSVVDGGEVVPLTIEQLREARCRFLS